MQHRYKNIDGWFDFDDIYADAVKEASDGAVFVELGSWMGRSSAYMGVEIANASKNILFYCIDTWKGSPAESYHGDVVRAHGGSLVETFKKNVEGLPVHAIESDSAKAADRFEDASVDFVFIDAGHGFADVTADIRAWYPKVKPGGVIAGHDIGWPGLFQAVQQRLPASELVIKRSSWWHRKMASTAGLQVPGDHLLFIPVVNNDAVFADTLKSVPSGVTAVVIDQSVDGRMEKVLRAHGGHVQYQRWERTSFSRMQNTVMRMAAYHGVKHLLFMHSDASCDPIVVEQLLERARQETSDWGVMFTNYDALAAFNLPKLMDRVGFWDETFEWYRSDCDFYYRVGLAGLAKVETSLSVHHRASSTINSDARELARVEGRSEWHKAHYLHKWGGEQGGERFTVPYDIKT